MSRRTTLYRQKYAGLTPDLMLAAIVRGHGYAETRDGPNAGDPCSLPIADAKAARLVARIFAPRKK